MCFSKFIFAWKTMKNPSFTFEPATSASVLARLNAPHSWPVHRSSEQGQLRVSPLKSTTGRIDHVFTCSFMCSHDLKNFKRFSHHVHTSWNPECKVDGFGFFSSTGLEESQFQSKFLGEDGEVGNSSCNSSKGAWLGSRGQEWAGNFWLYKLSLKISRNLFSYWIILIYSSWVSCLIQLNYSYLKIDWWQLRHIEKENHHLKTLRGIKSIVPVSISQVAFRTTKSISAGDGARSSLSVSKP